MGATCQTEAPRNLGKYTLVEKLAEGYLGPVYKALDPDIGQAVAIRIVSAGIRWDENVEARFYLEFLPVASLRHPNIAAILGIDKEGQSPYIVTELLSGSDLGTLIGQKVAMSWEEKLSIMIMVAEGLSHAHKNGILHRNLKPGKIQLTADGSAKIRDFDLAHILMRHLPYPGVRCGTPVYWSPEQIQHKECDERSDIFSAGIVFYELLTYLHPFHDRNSNKALDNILFNTQIPSWDEFPEVPQGIWPILRKCLAKDPNDRFGSVAEISSACSKLLKELTDESQLMHAEPNAAASQLKQDAGQPAEALCSVKYPHDLQKLSHDEEESDYAFLDRMMSAPIEPQPAIPSISGAPPSAAPIRAVPLPEEPPIPAAISMEALPPASERRSEEEELPRPVQPSATILTPGSSEQPPDSSQEAAFTEQTLSTGKAVMETKAESCESGLDEYADSGIEPPQSVAMPFNAMEPANPSAAPPHDDAVPLHTPVDDISSAGTMPPVAGAGVPAHRYRRIPKSTYRSAAALLSILLIAVSLYLVRYSGSATFVRAGWLTHRPGSSSTTTVPAPQPSVPKPKEVAAPMGVEESQEETDPVAVQVLLKEAEALVAQQRFEESKVFIRRILEINPTHATATAILKEINAGPSRKDRSGEADEALQKRLARVSALISSGKLQNAKVELDKLQQIRPEPPGLPELRKRFEARNSKMASDIARKEEEQKAAGRKRKEEESTRRLAEMFAHGKYDEARGTLSLWLAEDPANPRAQEFRAKLEEVQRSLKAYESAMAENRYQDAFNALSSAEHANPTDTHLAELRRRVEANKANARAILTVHRLGEKAILLLDGKPIGNDGEIERESIPIGNHTLAIEDEKGLIVAKSQEFLDGQTVVFVHDSAKRQLRSMTEADRELLNLRRAKEEVHRIAVEHDHGWLRGNCKGELLVNYLEVKYKPASGAHGFRLPFKRLKLKIRGKSLDLTYASDDRDFQSFKVQDAEAAEKFKRIWDNLLDMGQ